jgi:hypothetical protein
VATAPLREPSQVSNLRPVGLVTAEPPPRLRSRGEDSYDMRHVSPGHPNSVRLLAQTFPRAGHHLGPVRPCTFLERSCAPDAGCVLCADNRWHQPTTQARQSETLSSLCSLSSTVSRCVRLAALAGPSLASPQFPEVSGNISDKCTACTLNGCLNIKSKETACLNNLLHGTLLELLLVQFGWTGVH